MDRVAALKVVIAPAQESETPEVPRVPLVLAVPVPLTIFSSA